MSCNNYLRVITLIFLLILVGGCGSQTAKDSWKGTKSLYRSYLNVPAKVDLQKRPDLADADSRLAESVRAIDLELSQLERWMDNAPTGFDESWVRQTLKRFPWLSGVALVDAEGTVVANQTQAFMKEFDVKALLKSDPKQRPSSLRAHVQTSPLGHEIYLGSPIFYGDEFRGLMTAFFDVGNIAGLSHDPDHLILASNSGVVWSGQYLASSLPMHGHGWSGTMLKKPSGVISNSHGTLKWTSRYFANLLLAYAVVESGTFPENKEPSLSFEQNAD